MRDYNDYLDGLFAETDHISDKEALAEYDYQQWKSECLESVSVIENNNPPEWDLFDMSDY